MASWEPAERVDVPSAQQSWESLTFLHLGYDPANLAHLLPEGLTFDTHDGLAWVGLTPFRLHASVLPAAPGPKATSVEVNVRTYVRDVYGRDGIWFLSLDIDQPAVATALRAALGLPYRWSDTWIQDQGPVVRYGAQRRAPHRPGSFTLAVEIGEPLDDPGEFETYLVGRWRAFTDHAGTRLCVPVEHAPWRLVDGELLDWRSEGFLGNLGLPDPITGPHVLFSPGVDDVKLGLPVAAG
jgi:uncharacterized protein